MTFLDSFQIYRFLVRLAIVDGLASAVSVLVLTLVAIDLVQESALLVHGETVGRGVDTLVVVSGAVTW